MPPIPQNTKSVSASKLCLKLKDAVELNKFRKVEEIPTDNIDEG